MKDQQDSSWIDDPEHWYRNPKGYLFRNEEGYPVDGSVRVPSEEARWELRRRDELEREYYGRKDQISYEEMLTRKLLRAGGHEPSSPSTDTEGVPDLRMLKRKLALILDQSVYSDSYGVPGSSFSVCRWCGGGSGPGGNPGFKHNTGCLMDDDVLEAKVADVWEEVPVLESEITQLKAKLAEEERAHEHTLTERDEAEDCVGQIYAEITGKQVEWSNLFGYDEAFNEISEAIHALKGENNG